MRGANCCARLTARLAPPAPLLGDAALHGSGRALRAEFARPLPPRRRRRSGTVAQAKRTSGGVWGNQNRLGPARGGDPGGGDDSSWDAETSMLQLQDMSGPQRQPTAAARPWLATKLGQLQYKYFNWRQDTWSDLQLFLVLNSAVFLAGAWIEGSVIRGMDATVPPLPEGAGPLQQAWHDLYTVLAVVLGQDLPAGSAAWPSQLFAVLVAVFGLASFALVLALIEQVVLEVLESNVKRGSLCYEQGHTVVLAYCESSRGIAQVTRILTQLCAANRAAGGGVVVVLTQHRGKLEMEQLFREVVPTHHRYGTRFVFRQGSSLDPAALRLVAVPDARSVIVCTDWSKPSKDADAQVLRTCVLVDEMVTQEHPTGGGPTVVAQTKTENALPLVRYACSERVVPVATNRINARRYVRLLHHPIAAVFSRCLSDFYSPAHGSIDSVPEVAGCTFAELHFRFLDAIVVGLSNRATGSYRLNPPPETVVGPDDEVISLRPESVAPGRYRALPEGVQVELGRLWDPDRYVMRSQDDNPMGVDAFSSTDQCMAQSARATQGAMACRLPRDGATMSFEWGAPVGAQQQQAERFQSSEQGLFMLPVQYRHNLTPEDELLICGWMGNTFMWQLLEELDHSNQALPPGSKVTLLNDHSWTQEVLEARCREHGIRSLQVRHVRGDPRSRADMQCLVDVTKFKGAIVVCDSLWTSDDAVAPNADGGLRLLSQAEMLSLDAAVLMVQLNIRLLLEEARHPAISIICEKLTYVGVTRFEDDKRLPLGIAVNSASYAAKALTQASVDPRFLQLYTELGQESDVTVQDAASFALEGEELSFLQLQARAASVRQVLLGWYRVPQKASQPLEMAVNPQGLEERSKLRVWNCGDSRYKLVTLAFKQAIRRRVRSGSGSVAGWDGSSGSLDGGGGAGLAGTLTYASRAHGSDSSGGSGDDVGGGEEGGWSAVDEPAST